MVEVMWTLGQIAERDQVSKQAVQKSVAKLVEQGVLPVERDARGRIARVSLAHYDHHRDLFGNGTKAPPAADQPGDGSSVSSSYDEARRQEAWLRVERAKLDRAKEMGQLVRADKLGEALANIGRTIQREVDRLQHSADDLAMVVGREGVSGLRIALRKKSLEMNLKISDALRAVAEASPEFDDPLWDDEGPSDAQS